MIQFACPHCAIRYKVSDDFAGRSTRCTSCQQLLIVPLKSEAIFPVGEAANERPLTLALDAATLGFTPPPSPGGELSSLSESPSPSTWADELPQNERTSNRYLIGDEIARGGMGAVRRGVDRDLRREVAVKFMLNNEDARLRARFIEEAQITGQLEHPNIVPIHELGLDAQKRLFFAMKMVNGKSLGDILKRLNETPAETEKTWSLGRLIFVFGGICNAIAYAHARGVIHRDLKPANVMIGDFGEVYVMDWGLAKVLDKAEVVPEKNEKAGLLPTGVSRPPSFSTIATNMSDGVTEFTQDGAILGTPAYMAPEQARGDTHATDPRSDIYSLGAILYAILTLQSPIEKGENYHEMLMRAAQGKIKPPEARTPRRFIPRELSAIAMKALATNPAERYQTVDDLRHDIERFQEDRSVSAKRDTAWEMAKKFAKRNKGLSTGLGLTLLMLVVSLIVVFVAWRETNTAYLAGENRRLETVAANVALENANGATSKAKVALENQLEKTNIAHAKFEDEQKAKEDRTRKAVPALLEAAQLAIQEKHADQALLRVNVALDYEPTNAEARLLKGQILASQKAFVAAMGELDQYVKLRPKDALAAKLAKLCAAPDMDLPGAKEAIGNVLVLQKQPLLALTLFMANDQRLLIYRKQIDAAWPGLSSSLQLDKHHNLTFSVTGSATKFPDKLIDLKPLQGIPLTSLRLNQMKTRDLSALRGMPLTILTMSNFPFVKDLDVLRDMPLQTLSIQKCPLVENLDALKGLPIENLSIVECPRVRDLKPLAGMPLINLVLRAGGVDVEDISPLQRAPIQKLTISFAQIKDIEALRGMPLQTLDLRNCRKLKDLSPLRGMALQELLVDYTAVEDLEPIRGMPLSHFDCGYTKVQNIGPLQGMDLASIIINGSVRDLAPLQGMNIETIHLPYGWSKLQGLDILRGMESLRRIRYGLSGNYEPAEFWKKIDAGELK